MKLPMLIGSVSTALFICSNFPMLFKAFQTKDLHSYSLSHIVFCNIGNVAHWFYISSLPFGPIWFLHGFSTISTFLMLVWYIKFELRTKTSQLSRAKQHA